MVLADGKPNCGMRMIKKKSNKPIPGMRRELTKVFNKYIRLRDRKFGCISCTTGAVENAGHFKSRGAHPHPSIAFSEMNTHGQCIRCNYTLAGNIPGYTVGLRNRYGLQILHDIFI